MLFGIKIATMNNNLCQRAHEPEDLPTANATNPTLARRDRLREDILCGVAGEEDVASIAAS